MANPKTKRKSDGRRGGKTRSRGAARVSAPARKVRYAVVGLGYIAQVAVLPAFRNARKNSELVALVSDDPRKLSTLARKYRVPHTYDYESFAECLANDEIDAVFIALPNHLHREYAVAAAEAGKHVLCEKPLAVTEEDCLDMIAAAQRNGVRLMTAYRLHFERANMKAVEIVRSGKIGEPRIFQSVFTMQVEDEDNIRLGPTPLGGGPLYDIGIYCLNAARYLFRTEPTEVFAFSANLGEERFARCDEMLTAVMKFPVERLASFTCSFGASPTGWYQIVGTRGDLRLDPAYEYAEPLEHVLTVDETTRGARFPKRDQFAPELIYFSDCVLQDREPEPSGREGLADVRVIRALLESARTGLPVRLGTFERQKRPTLDMEMQRAPVAKPELVHAQSPSGD